MYSIKTSESFDAAHFLSGYQGKCSNLHGHRWKVEVTICCEQLCENEQHRGMCTDFSILKNDLKSLTDVFDHRFMYEKGTLKPATIAALGDEGFEMVPLDFRPTAENLAEYFYNEMKKKGYMVKNVDVYETPNNCASYSEQ